MQPGGALAAEYHSDGEGATDRPMTRAKILAGVPAGPWLAWRRAKRRKTSEIVTMIEIMMRTMMIQVWSKMGLVERLGSEKESQNLRDVRLSAIESDNISARSRNTRHLSLRT